MAKEYRSEKMKYTIYKTINLINNKIYIGMHFTEDINDDYLGSGKHLQRAINRCGRENFKKEVLFIFDNEQEMIEKEIELVNEDFIKRNDTYNLKIGGLGGGGKHSDKSKRKMSKSPKGKIFSDETKRKISEANKGKKLSDKAKRKMSKSAKNRPPVSDETKRKISSTEKGKIVSDETRQKMREAWKIRKIKSI